MNEIKLHPCPFCGKGFRINALGAYEHDNETCILHGFKIRNYKGIKAWNTRKLMDAVVEKLEKDTTCRFRLDGYIPKSKAIEIVRNAGKDGAE